MPVSDPDPAGLHYKLAAYICAGGCVKLAPFEGVVTFRQVYDGRPFQCRYAVARETRLFSRDDMDWLAWDFFKIPNYPINEQVRAPAPLWRGGDPDALIMKAIALYDQDS